MGILTSVKNFMGFGNLDEYDEEDYNEAEAVEEAEAEDMGSHTRRKKASNVIPLTTRNDAANVQILKPQVYEDSYKIANVVKADLVAIFDVAEMSDCDVATRVVDFVSGAVFALGGNMRKVAPGIFIATPRQVDVSGDTIGEHTRNNFNWNYGSDNT